MVAMQNILALVALWISATAAQTPQATTMNIKNGSGREIDIYWIDMANDEEAYPMRVNPALTNGESMRLNTFSGHVFEGVEVGGSTKTRVLVPSDMGDCVASIDSSFEVTYTPLHLPEEAVPPKVSPPGQAGQNDEEFIEVPALPLPKELKFDPVPRGECLKLVNLEDPVSVLDDLVACVQSNVTHELLRSKEHLVYQQQAAKNHAQFFENYTCADHGMPTSPAIRTEVWKSPHDQGEYPVKVLHERPSSKIHVVSNFISQEECDAMEEAARPILHKATVADGKGGSTLSPNRKAMQAGITVPWAKEKDGDLIAKLSRRVYDYVNHVTGLNIEHHGQEDLMSIQYFGRGANDTEPDRYMPHCDGECTGRPHKFGNRMATMVLYCTIPTVGGATNFRNAGLHIHPTKGAGTFFSYIDVDQQIMDTGYTEHSGCPVIEGEKKIVTQWVRYGVDTENTWDSFNTLGLKKTSEDEET